MSNVTTKIETPISGQEDAQIEAIVHFMAKHGQVVYNPIIFLQGWHTRKLKIIVRRRDNEIVGVHIVLLLTDPVTNKTHAIDSFTAGEDLSEVARSLTARDSREIN